MYFIRPSMVKKVLELRFKTDDEISLDDLMKKLQTYSDEGFWGDGPFSYVSKCVIKKVKTENGYEEMFFREKGEE